MAAQDDYDMLSGLAERMGLEDNDRDDFLSSAMKRLGYKARAIWEDGGNDESNGDFFSRRRQSGNSGNSRKASGENWQYGGGR